MITYTFVQLLSQNAIDAEKLAYIDFKLFFTGTLSRTDIGDTFGLKEASEVISYIENNRGSVT